MIQKLPDSIVARIAAGEVITSPSNILKELIENSMDAKSTRIRVSLSSSLCELSVADNGTGIEKDDLALACCDHCTSKLISMTDMDWCGTALGTYGFRGEALHSISQCAKVSIVSRTDAIDSLGHRAVYNGPKIESLTRLAVEERGTVVEVSDIFYNNGIRREHFAKNKTELIRCINLVKAFSTIFSGLSLHVDGKAVVFYSVSPRNILPLLSDISGNDDENKRNTTVTFSNRLPPGKQLSEVIENKLEFIRTAFIYAGPSDQLQYLLSLSPLGLSSGFSTDDTLEQKWRGDDGVKKGSKSAAGVDGSEDAERRQKTQGHLSAPKRSYFVVFSGKNIHFKKFNFILFVNRRLVFNETLKRQISRAYRSILGEGKYPFVLLELYLPYVDVNVHPSKSEVLFDEGVLYSEIVAAMERAILEEGPIVYSAKGQVTPSNRVRNEERRDGSRISAAGSADVKQQRSDDDSYGDLSKTDQNLICRKMQAEGKEGGVAKGVVAAFTAVDDEREQGRKEVDVSGSHGNEEGSLEICGDRKNIPDIQPISFSRDEEVLRKEVQRQSDMPEKNLSAFLRFSKGTDSLETLDPSYPIAGYNHHDPAGSLADSDRLNTAENFSSSAYEAVNSGSDCVTKRIYKLYNSSKQQSIEDSFYESSSACSSPAPKKVRQVQTSGTESEADRIASLKGNTLGTQTTPLPYDAVLSQDSVELLMESNVLSSQHSFPDTKDPATALFHDSVLIGTDRDHSMLYIQHQSYLIRIDKKRLLSEYFYVKILSSLKESDSVPIEPSPANVSSEACDVLSEYFGVGMENGLVVSAPRFHGLVVADWRGFCLESAKGETVKLDDCARSIAELYAELPINQRVYNAVKKEIVVTKDILDTCAIVTSVEELYRKFGRC